MTIGLVDFDCAHQHNVADQRRNHLNYIQHAHERQQNDNMNEEVTMAFVFSLFCCDT